MVQKTTVVMELEPRQSNSERLTPLLRSLRALAMQQAGFEGGMIWFCEEKSKQLVVLSHWSTLEAWEGFKKATGTTEVLSSMAALLSGPLKERHLTKPDDSNQFPRSLY